MKKNIIFYFLLLGIFSLVLLWGDSFAQTSRMGLQNSPQTQEFKERQQKKMQDYLANFERENKEFVKTLEGMSREQKILAVKDFISKQYEKNCAFRKKMYEEQRSFIKKQLNKNPNMPKMMKERMLARIDEDYNELKDFHAKKIEEDMEFLDNLLKDSSIDGQELNNKLQEFFKGQKLDAQNFLNRQQRRYHNPSGSLNYDRDSSM
ncbi:MAG: hypothetical protein NC904_06240 [Candidatus Omnitrophica bacterium]|nr:hypothetical protein [Candidatus Omnitrophota bacterium]